MIIEGMEEYFLVRMVVVASFNSRRGRVAGYHPSLDFRYKPLILVILVLVNVYGIPLSINTKTIPVTPHLMSK